MVQYALIVAGGKGLRMGTELPKQFLPIGGKPVLMRTLEAFYDYNAEIRIILVDSAEPVSQTYKLTFEQWLEQQHGKIDVDCGCVSTETLMHWMRVAYEAGNSPVPMIICGNHEFTGLPSSVVYSLPS